MQHTALAHFVFATAAVPCFLLLIFMHTLCVHRCNLSSTTHTHHQWQATTSQTEESPSRRQLLSNASILPSILLLQPFPLYALPDASISTSDVYYSAFMANTQWKTQRVITSVEEDAWRAVPPCGVDWVEIEGF